ncbi:unnamed protein product, partial [Discosporangium mesarthrocarpum]
MKLGVGVRELPGSGLLVQVLNKPQEDGAPGAAECAGIRKGDVIFGVNYQALDGRVPQVSALLKEAFSRAHFARLQISRDATSSSVVQDPLPSRNCPLVTTLLCKAGQLRKAGVLDADEGHILLGMILQCMAWDEGVASALHTPAFPLVPSEHPTGTRPSPGTLSGRDSVGPHSPPSAAATPAPMPASCELDSLVMHAKGLREAIGTVCLTASYSKELKDEGSTLSSAGITRADECHDTSEGQDRRGVEERKAVSAVGKGSRKDSSSRPGPSCAQPSSPGVLWLVFWAEDIATGHQ